MAFPTLTRMGKRADSHLLCCQFNIKVILNSLLSRDGSLDCVDSCPFDNPDDSDDDGVRTKTINSPNLDNIFSLAS